MDKQGMPTNSIIQTKSLAFAIRIVKLTNYLFSKREYIISKQILRSGTSIGANIEEAYGGTTTKEFRLRISISYREARETLFWLIILKEGGYLDLLLFNSLSQDCRELIKILSSIHKTIKANDKQSK